MKYETFYKLFIQHGFSYLTTERNIDIYQRDGHEYMFNFTAGFIYRHPYKTRQRRFNRTVIETQQELLKYFKDERRNEAVELWRKKKG